MAVYFTGMGSGLIDSVKIYTLPKYPPVDTNWLTAPSTVYTTAAAPNAFTFMSMSDNGRVMVARTSDSAYEYRIATNTLQEQGVILNNFQFGGFLLTNGEVSVTGDGNKVYLADGEPGFGQQFCRIWELSRPNQQTAFTRTQANIGNGGTRYGVGFGASSNGLVRAMGSSYYNSSYADRVGRVQIYSYDPAIPGGTGTGQIIESPYPTDDDASFGRIVRVSADGRTVAVAGGGHDLFSGYLRVYEVVGNAWVQVVATGFALSPVRQLSDMAISADGNVIAMSGTSEFNGSRDRGRISIFRRAAPGAPWAFQNTIIPTTSAVWYGDSVSLNSDGTVLAATGRYNTGIWTRTSTATAFTNAYTRVLGSASYKVQFSRDDGFLYAYTGTSGAYRFDVFKAGPDPV